MEKQETLPDLPGYMPLPIAARLMGLSRRMANQYVQNGKLRGFKAGRNIMVKIEDVEKFQPNATGRPRERVPVWRLPVGKNLQFVTTIFTRIKPGQRENFDQKLKEIHSNGDHFLVGTVARYIVRSEKKPDDIEILLVWRSTVMPPEEEREADLEALRQEFAEILDWETSWEEFGQVLMHT